MGDLRLTCPERLDSFVVTMSMEQAGACQNILVGAHEGVKPGLELVFAKLINH